MAVYIQDGIEVREDDIPLGWSMVDYYQPHSCPWDYYGNKQVMEWRAIMAKADIECKVCVTRKARVNPMGSGPGGRVRFGDEMMPSEYRLYVLPQYFAAAFRALESHDQAVSEWLHNNGPRPSTLV